MPDDTDPTGHPPGAGALVPRRSAVALRAVVAVVLGVLAVVAWWVLPTAGWPVPGWVPGLLLVGGGAWSYRSMRALRRRRLWLDATGVAAEGWRDPVRLHRAQVRGAEVRRRRRGPWWPRPQLRLDTTSGPLTVDLLGFDVDTVRSCLAGIDARRGTAGDRAIDAGTGRLPGLGEAVTLRPQRRRTAGAAALLLVLSGMLLLCARSLLLPERLVVPSLPLLDAAIVAGLAAISGYGVVVVYRAACAVQLRARITLGPDGIELTAPSQPRRPVRIPWSAVLAAELHVTDELEDHEPLPVPRRGELRLRLGERPAEDLAVLELMETEPGHVVYPVSGFDVSRIAVLLERALPARP